MTSSASPFTPSPEPQPRPRRRGWRTWPEDLLLPVLIGIVQTLAITPLLYLVFGGEFGLTGGRPVMWPGGLTLLGLVGFWLSKFISRVTANPRHYTAAMGIGWLVAAAAWVGLEPVYGLRGLLAEPGSLVESRAYLIAPFLLSLGVWWQGIRYATIDFLITAEEVRGSTQRSWLVLIGTLVLAVLIDNDASRSAISTTPVVVPTLMVASVALVAAAEIHASRQQISRSGGRPPTWSRWGRLVGGLGVAILIVVLVVTVLLTPGSLAAMVGAIGLMIRGFGQLLYWLFSGIFYILYYIFYAITELFSALFDLNLQPPEPPEQPTPPAAEQMLPEQQQRDQGEVPYANLIRWGLLGLAVLAVILLLFRFTRGRSGTTTEEIGDEERSSVFSTDLAKSQLRDLLRRRHRGSRIPKLNLDAPPGSVREAWRYLQVLAVRQDAGRAERETPQDFAARLRAVWPGTATPLNDLTRRYERSRYGDLDSERDRDAATDDWTEIYRRRRDIDVERRDE